MVLIIDDPKGISAPVKHVKLPALAVGRLAGHAVGMGSAEGVLVTPDAALAVQLLAAGALQPAVRHTNKLLNTLGMPAGSAASDARTSPGRPLYTRMRAPSNALRHIAR